MFPHLPFGRKNKAVKVTKPHELCVCKQLRLQRPAFLKQQVHKWKGEGRPKLGRLQMLVNMVKMVKIKFSDA